MSHSLGSTGGGLDRSVLVPLVAAGLLVGALVAPFAAGVATRGEPAKVAVVPLSGVIGGNTASDVVAQLERARHDPSVKAVVLQVNSPGGAAAASESLYLAVKRLAEEKPVVVSVSGIAASGAYYASVPADAIYVKPASIVGSVGVLAPIPPELEPNDLIAATGPEKIGLASERGFKYTIETVKRAFVNAVMTHRGEELELSRAAVSRAGIYSGVVAVRNGFADEIGALPTAIARAAELADLDEYQVVRLEPTGPPQYVSRAAYVASDDPDKRMISPTELTGIGARGSSYATILMLPPRIAFAVSDRYARPGNGTAANATVAGNATATAAGGDDG